MEDVDQIITDSKVSPAIAKRIEEMGIVLTIADEPLMIPSGRS